VTERVDINPSLIRWAVDRSGRTTEGLIGKFPKLRDWQSEQRAKLTFVELERLSSETHTPMGFFFLDQPPPQEVPIPDFRTVKDKALGQMSPDLVDTIHAMQLRQSWYQSFAVEEGWPRFHFVGSAKPSDSIKHVAQDIRKHLQLTPSWASKVRTWDDAVSVLREKIESLGILIVINGCVGNNTFRVLDPEEFRGFVISDSLAPLVFVNGHDAKSAQVFTMLHELAHLWVNRSGIFDLKDLAPPIDATEKYCNEVAAEALIPEDELQTIWYSYANSKTAFQDIAKHFKVSPIVAGRRLLDLSLVSKKTFFEFYADYQTAVVAQKRDPGGSFYNNQNFRIGKRFMRIVSRAADEGRITYNEAYKLTGLNNATFDEYLKRIGGAQ
jgi:Zn-dependent peptidase ImmA (M78 family)